jgi:hypothetical protein
MGLAMTAMQRFLRDTTIGQLMMFSTFAFLLFFWILWRIARRIAIALLAVPAVVLSLFASAIVAPLFLKEVMAAKGKRLRIFPD